MDTRNPVAAEINDIVSRISKAFSYNKEEGSVARDFPQLYNSLNSKRLWAAYEGAKFVAHAGFYPTIMRVETLPLPVAGIGGVYTEPEFQGQGVASELVKKCAMQAAKEGAALAFLWSDKHEFYAKLGFYLSGRQWTLSFALEHAAKLRARGLELGLRAEDVSVVEGDLSDEFLMESRTLLSELPLGISRTMEEHATYLRSGACRVIGAWIGKDLVAYFVLGKGKDLQGYVHEWAGEEAALHHLAAQCLESFGTGFHLLSPQFMPDEVNWLYALDELGVPMRAEYMGLVKLLDFTKVKKLVADYMTALGLPAADLVLQKFDEEYLVKWRDGTELKFSEKEFLRFLFGPEMPAHPELKAFLPLRLWYWGMDSV
jgi:predicted N-acetyltransferase YhbS